MKKCTFMLNTKPEKIIAAASLSAALAFLFGSGKNKKNKSFARRLQRNYKTLDNILSVTIARDVKKNEERKIKEAEKNSYKTKLRELEIEDSIPLDLR